MKLQPPRDGLLDTMRTAMQQEIAKRNPDAINAAFKVLATFSATNQLDQSHMRHLAETGVMGLQAIKQLGREDLIPPAIAVVEQYGVLDAGIKDWLLGKEALKA